MQLFATIPLPIYHKIGGFGRFCSNLSISQHYIPQNLIISYLFGTIYANYPLFSPMTAAYKVKTLGFMRFCYMLGYTIICHH